MTAVQMVAAFSAVANGGRLMQPQIVRALLDAQGREIRSFEPKTVRQVISPETARTLTEMMVNVVANGTGRHAAIPGYDVAGKTGTAQKMDPATKRYSRAPGVLSFVGFVPADDPRLTMIVLLDEPKNEKWGSEAAAPIFAAIGREALRYLNVPPRDSSPVPIVRGEIVAGLAAPRAGGAAEPAAPAASRAGGPGRGGARRGGRRPGGDAAPRRPLAPPGHGSPRALRGAPRDHGPRRRDRPDAAARRPARRGRDVPAPARVPGRPRRHAAMAASLQP